MTEPQRLRYNCGMTPKLSKELSQALQNKPGTPLEVEDPETSTLYVLVTREQFTRLQDRLYDDGELTTEEMLAAAAPALNDPAGWGAAGMDEYDRPDLTDTDTPST